MKIGLLTLPLSNNYGAHLQAWALQNILEQLGHNVLLLNVQPSGIMKRRFLVPIKKTIASIIRLLPNHSSFHYVDYRFLQEKHFNTFRNSNFVLSKRIYSTKGLRNTFLNEKCEGIIVGSDQVWRKWSFIPLSVYFLPWLNIDMPKLGYAISYGKDEWEMTDKETQRYTEYIKKFSCLSMREKKGVEITK